MICTIVGAMPEHDLTIPENAFLIAADQGLVQLTEKGIIPDLAVGDFDSLGYVPEGLPVVRHPVRKDDTDMLLAVREGLSRGYKTFLLYGGMGGRLDHTLANVQTLAFLLRHDAKGVLFGRGTAVTLLQNERVCLSAREKGDLSVFAFGGAAGGVCERGLSYTMENATLLPDFPLGVSNSFCGKTAEISVQTGMLLLTWQTNAQETIAFLEHA